MYIKYNIYTNFAFSSTITALESVAVSIVLCKSKTIQFSKTLTDLPVKV